MQINIIAMGTKMPAWVQSGYNDYVTRLSKYCKINLTELPLALRGKNTNSNTTKKVESELILSKINKQNTENYKNYKNHIIALDLSGQDYTTEQLAEYLNNLVQKTPIITFIIGGPDGLAEPCLDYADHKLALSKFTLPHPLVRIILVEQIYRAFSLLNNHPYHK